MKYKIACILECKLYSSTIFLLILIGFVNIVQLAAGRTTRECDPENPLCEHCVIANKSLCIRCKNITLCSVDYYANDYVTCLTKCPKDMYYKKMKEQRVCCQPCHEGCLDGCTGKEPYLGENGCNECKYAFREDDGRLRCLKYSDNDNACAQVSPGNYYPIVSHKALTKMEFECIKCHPNCRSCSSDGNDYDLDGCRCAKGTELAKKYRNNKTINVCESIVDFRKSPDPIEILLTQQPKITSRTSKKVILLISSSERSPSVTEPLLNSFSGDNSKITNILITVLVIVAMVPLVGVLLILLVIKCFAKTDLKRSSIKSLSESDQLPPTPSSTEPLIGPCSQKMKLNLCDVEVMPLNRSISQPSSAIPQSPVHKTGNQGNIFFSAPRQTLVKASSISEHNKLRIINKKQITLFKKINEGQFGEVYEGIYNNQSVAIKMLKTRNTSSINEAIEESTFMAKHTFPHLQKLIGICPTDGVWIISELRIGSLKDFLKNNRYCLTVRNLLLYSAQIASAIEFLHVRNKYHGDLAARNVLVKDINHVEVGDFGLSKALKRGQTGYKSNGKAAFRWMSPECLRSWVFDMANDVWAFGVTCWEMFTFGKVPYEGVNLTSNHGKRIHLEDLENGSRLAQPNEINCLDAYSIMLKCWTYPPEGRIKIKEVKEAFEGLLHDLDPSYVSLEPDLSQ